MHRRSSPAPMLRRPTLHVGSGRLARAAAACWPPVRPAPSRQSPPMLRRSNSLAGSSWRAETCVAGDAAPHHRQLVLRTLNAILASGSIKKGHPMPGLGENIAQLVRNRRQRETAAGAAPAGTPGLVDVQGFGSNPGGLRMLAYVPKGLPPGAPLVAALHGCTQTAAGYDAGAGWSRMAERHGFAVLLPEQVRGNNPNTCFNWFQPADTARGSGEAESIRQGIAPLGHHPQPEPGAGVHHRPVRRRRDGGSDVGGLSRGVRGRGDHRRAALWRSALHAGSIRGNGRAAPPFSAGMGGPGPPGVAAPRFLALHPDLAGRRGQHRAARQRGGVGEAVDGRVGLACRAIGGGPGRRHGAPGLAGCVGAGRARVLHGAGHGARYAHCTRGRRTWTSP